MMNLGRREAWAGVLVLMTMIYTTKAGQSCNPDKLTVYRVYLNTMWGREVFPKQYPEWRPPAQWSKLLGKSIDDK